VPDKKDKKIYNELSRDQYCVEQADPKLISESRRTYYEERSQPLKEGLRDPKLKVINPI